MKVVLKHAYNSWQVTKLLGINMKKKNMFIEAFGNMAVLSRKLAGPRASPQSFPWCGGDHPDDLGHSLKAAVHVSSLEARVG